MGWKKYLSPGRTCQKSVQGLTTERSSYLCLEQKGYTPVTLSGLALTDLMAVFQNSKKIIEIHGVCLTNLMFCDSGSDVIEILPSTYHPRYYRDISDIFNLNHKAFIVESDKRGDSMWI